MPRQTTRKHAVAKDDPKRLETLLACARAIEAIVAKVDSRGPQVAVMGATGCTVNVGMEGDR